MSPEERKREKARQLRYKKPIAKGLNLMDIQNSLDEMAEACDEVRYWTEQDDDILYAALDGDEDDAYEFKMMFADLTAEIERFREDLFDRYYTSYKDELVINHFDDVMVGIGAGEHTGGYLGWDSYEGDYFGIEDTSDDWLESEAGKKLERLTKKELIETMGECLKVVMAYIGLQNRYDSIKAALDILRDENMSYLKEIKKIDELYLKADERGWYKWTPEVKAFIILESLATPDDIYILKFDFPICISPDRSIIPFNESIFTHTLKMCHSFNIHIFSLLH